MSSLEEIQDLYNIREILSSENRSDIFLAKEISSGKDVVIKSSEKRRAINELKIFKDVLRERHPHIIQFYTSFEDNDCVYMILEYANGGDLLDLCKDKQLISENNIKVLFKQILEGVRHIHSLKYYHGDLKPENVLVFKNNTNDDITLKLIDFEFTRSYREDMLIRSGKGTLNYAAPELLCRDSFIGPEVDIWALGVILYIITFKIPLFSHDEHGTFRDIFNEFTQNGFKLTRIISYELHQLLTGLLTVDRTKRFKMEDILESAWLTA